MNPNDFLIKFSELFEEVKPESITLQSKFRDIEGWSSLIALSIIAMADEAYGVKLKGDDIRNATTVQDLFEIIKSKI